jgi:hypothetical protein
MGFIRKLESSGIQGRMNCVIPLRAINISTLDLVLNSLLRFKNV